MFCRLLGLLLFSKRKEPLPRERIMLLRESIIKLFPELVTPDLMRKTSKKHWRKTRNLTAWEKDVAALMQPKEVVISRKVIHSQESFPILEISDDDLSI